MDKTFEQFYYELEKDNWWFVTRRDLLRQLFRKHLTQEGKVLDIGCGTGKNLQYFNFKDMYGIDISHDAVKKGHEQGVKTLVVGDGAKLPFKEESFDTVLCLDLLEHLADDTSALADIQRVLKPGGTAFIFLPAFKALWGPHDEVNHHLRRYKKQHVQQLGKQIGLPLRETFYWNSLLFFPVLVYRFFRRMSKGELRSDHPQHLPEIVNKTLKRLLHFENKLIKGNFKLPFGVSLVAVYQKSVTN